MALTTGSKLGPYEILSPIGAGGMGEVYRARDTRLEREVALKILPEAFVGDPMRLMRFEQEARMVGALNHPNICAIYDVGTEGGVHYLVCELMEGDTLRGRMLDSPLPLRKAVDYGVQIANGLAAAHEKGIIHRDLKPDNLFVTRDGRVKIFDFGLAKAEPASTPAGGDSPTLTAHDKVETQAGVVVGTAGYMSPEQVRGKPADHRSDLFALGATLYEMVSGQRAFHRESSVETMNAILNDDPPDLLTNHPSVPPALERLIRRCLEKSPAERFQSARDLGFALEALSGHTTSAAVAMTLTAKRKWLRIAAGGVLVAAAGATIALAVLAGLRPEAAVGTGRVSRLSIALPSEAPFGVPYTPGACLALSRDGSRVVYCGGDPARRLYLRRLDELEARPIAGTEGGVQPFFSPDGEWVAFFTEDGALKKVTLAGGKPVTLLRDLPNSFYVLGSWADGGVIVFDTWNAGLRAVPADGGPMRTLTAPASEWHLDPQVLPGSQTVIYTIQTDDDVRLEALSLNGGGSKTLLKNASHARYIASGHLLFMRDGGVMVAPFDKEKIEVTGPAASMSLNLVVDDVTVSTPVPQLAVSLQGTLVYAPVRGSEGRESTFVWVDRSGRATEEFKLPVGRPYFQLSPDGERLALASREGSSVRIQTYGFSQKALTRLADQRQDTPALPVWSRDGRKLILARFGTHRGELMSWDLEGNAPPRRLLKVPGTWLAPRSLSPDGRFLAYSVYDPKTAGDIWILDLGAPSAADAVRPFVATSASENGPEFSPDGRWIAYVSAESGSLEIYVRRFPGGESKTRVSIAGGTDPQWSPDGRELFYLLPDGKRMMVVPVRTGPTVTLGEPRPLFDGRFLTGTDMGKRYAVSADGRRFLMVRGSQVPDTAELIVVQNWFAEVRRLVPAGE